MWLIQSLIVTTLVVLLVTSTPVKRRSSKELEDRSLVRSEIDQWLPDHGTNVWELSGRYEGDINFEDESDRNGLINKTGRWPAGIVPYYIDKESFNDEQVATIKHAIDEYHQRTCLKFRKKRAADPNYIEIVGSDSGCWSSVGMQRNQLYRHSRRQQRKQVLNLQTPNCVTFGVVLHELMHAIGFYHQQSASNRDDYVKINWENIKAGREHNFKKYAADEVTDFGIEYDYASVMHYSALAFSKNQRPTIEPVREGAKIGLRTNFSDSDVEKINWMYKDECEKRNVVEKDLEDLYWYFGE